MNNTWLLVADRARARLFDYPRAADGLVELQDFINPDGHKLGRDAQRGPLPRAQESTSAMRHAIEPRTSPEDKSSDRFARELGDALERGRVDHRYERLVLVAPPEFLGNLHRTLGKQVQNCIVAEVDKDLTAMPATKLGETLSAQLRA